MTQTQTAARCDNAHLPNTVSDCCGLIGPKGERPYHAPPTIHEIDEDDRVRSFDFASYSPRLGVYGVSVDGDGPDRGACYCEGVVAQIMERGEVVTVLDENGVEVDVSWNDCDRYLIRVTRRVFNGVECSDHPRFIFPPVNGTRTLGGYTFGVQPVGLSIDEAQQALTEAGCDWQGAENDLGDALWALQQAQDRVNALHDQQDAALAQAALVVAQADALARDDAAELHSDLFGFYPEAE